MKKIIALMFNLLVATLLTAAMGAPAIIGVGAGLLSGFLPGLPSGSFGMAIQKEIWQSDIVAGLFADNTFLSKAYNADMYVLAGKVVHIPQAGTPSATVKNRSSLPAAAVKRTDTEVSYSLDEYTTTPRLIQETEKVELSYDKRQSTIAEDKASLAEIVANEFIDAWAPAAAQAATCFLRTTGSAVAAHLDSATGNRMGMTLADVSAAAFKMNTQNIPKDNRYCLIDSWMYQQLLDSMTAESKLAFFSQADVANGTIGKLFGISFYERSSVKRYTNATTPVAKTWDAAGAATDNAAAIFWQQNSVERAMGEVKVFELQGDPGYYGDVISFLIRAGGRIRRGDFKGVVAVIQAATT